MFIMIDVVHEMYIASLSMASIWTQSACILFIICYGQITNVWFQIVHMRASIWQHTAKYKRRFLADNE